MKKWLPLIAVAMLALVGFTLLSNKDQNRPTNQNPTGPKPISASQAQYVEYSDDVIAQTAGTKILFFHASWCPQCRQLERSILSGTIPNGVTVIKVDYDSNQELRQKYGVTIQTTLVKVDDNGNLVEKYVAYDEPTLENLKLNLL
ncbi:MAG: thioredoxin family protein [Candidatus Saccharimonadales bacterium]